MEALRADERVGFNRLPRTEAGIYPADSRNASRKLLANFLATSTGFSLPPIVFTVSIEFPTSKTKGHAQACPFSRICVSPALIG